MSQYQGIGNNLMKILITTYLKWQFIYNVSQIGSECIAISESIRDTKTVNWGEF